LPTGNKIAGEPVDVGVAFLAVADDFLDKCSQLDIGELRYEDFIGTAKQSVRLAKESAIDTIIALTHTDIKKDYLLSLEVPEIDLILGGHDVGYKADIQNRIVKSGKDWKVSHIKLTLRSGETRPEIAVKQVTQRNGLAPDMECMKMFDKYVRIIEAKLKEVVFKTDADLDPNWNVVGTGESLLANFICDICADDYSIQEGQQDAEITILQAAVFTSNQRIEKGPITIKQIFDLFQKSQSILVVNLTGEEIVKLLEEGVQKLPEVAMELCHVSERLSYSVILPPPDEEHMDGAGANEDAESSSKADDLGSLKHRVKVRRVMFDKKPIVLKQMYKVAMTDKHLMGASWLSEAVMENPESRFFVPDIYAMRIQDLVLLYFEQHLKDAVPKWPREQVPGQVGGQVQKRINIITQEEEGVVCHGCRLWP
jgi:2',3'-cyclic-nucleotide 2'-phosphodiesterase (5'-nucleotidase family)